MISAWPCPRLVIDSQTVAQADRVNAQRKVLELAELRYRGGVAAYLEVLDAQRSLFSAELEEAQTIGSHLVSLRAAVQGPRRRMAGRGVRGAVKILACRVFETDGSVRGRLTDMEASELSPGEVTIRAAFSGINFKDALAVTGRGKIMRRLPLNAGVDVSGTVETSTDPRFKAGDAVLVNGMGLGEVQDGGFAELVRVPADWIVPLPEGLKATCAISRLDLWQADTRSRS